MDIPKIDQLFKFPDIEPLKLYRQQYCGSFTVTERFHRRIFDLNFSYDTQPYLELLKEFIFSDRFYRIICEGVSSILTACLILGDIYNELSKRRIRIQRFSCSIILCLGRTYYKNDRDSLDLYFEVLPSELVRIIVGNNVLSKTSGIELSFDINNLDLPVFLMDRYQILRYGKNHYKVNKMKFMFPPYDMLPLYVNVPFLREYARYMFANPPQPPVFFSKLYA
jgi:hypothetical protein